MSRNSRLVFSTDRGRIQPEDDTPTPPPQGDGIVRLRRETKGRKGKGVTLVDGLGAEDKELKAIAKRLKQLCGTGGAVKNGVVEIQGDQRDKLKPELEKMGYPVKLAGG